MNIFDYVDYYKDYTFVDKGFNEVDNVIFSCLAYVNYNYIISENKKDKKTIGEVANIYFETHSKKTDRIDI